MNDYFSGDDLPVAPPTGAPVAPPAAPAPAAPVPPSSFAPPSIPVAPAAPPSPDMFGSPAAVVPTAPVGGDHSLGRSKDEGLAPASPPPASAPGIQEVKSNRDAGAVPVLDDLLIYMVEHGGSDLHLQSGLAPSVRFHGDIRPIPGYDKLSSDVLKKMLFAIVPDKNRKRFEETLELDFAYQVPGVARFRVNIHQQRNSIGSVMRVIPWEIKSLEALGMPPVVATWAQLPRGFVLVTGPTGSGKSTTLAAIVDRANRTRAANIITVEDPIEFLHNHQKSVVIQREVGVDTLSFANALRHILRQDPDIILVGEMRDPETIGVALTAAETGHLVFATLHTQSAAETVSRIIDVFPPEQQQQIATQLAASLQAVMCQTLCKTADGNGRVAAVEIMICTPAIRALIRDRKLEQIPGVIETQRGIGMQTLDQNLAELVKSRQITVETAIEKCNDRKSLGDLLGIQNIDQLAAKPATAGSY